MQNLLRKTSDQLLLQINENKHSPTSSKSVRMLLWTDSAMVIRSVSWLSFFIGLTVFLFGLITLQTKFLPLLVFPNTTLSGISGTIILIKQFSVCTYVCLLIYSTKLPFRRKSVRIRITFSYFQISEMLLSRLFTWLAWSASGSDDIFLSSQCLSVISSRNKN